MTIQERIAHAEAGLKEQFARIDAIEEHGTRRILKAFKILPPVPPRPTRMWLPLQWFLIDIILTFYIFFTLF